MCGLPGRHLKVRPGDVCDTEGHENIPAVKAIQGETDSFGHETMYFCQACYDEWAALPDPVLEGTCDWCKKPDQVLQYRRDSDEGMSGPVYTVCATCVKKDNDSLQAELDDQYDDLT